MEQIKNVLLNLTEVVRGQAHFHHDDMIKIIATLEETNRRLSVLEIKMEEALAKMGGK